MAKASKNKKKQKRKKEEYRACVFCEEETSPSYKDFKYLSNFLTDRARIVGKERSGVCSKHQRKLTKAIKRARHLGLLPYAPSI